MAAILCFWAASTSLSELAAVCRRAGDRSLYSGALVVQQAHGRRALCIDGPAFGQAAGWHRSAGAADSSGPLHLR